MYSTKNIEKRIFAALLSLLICLSAWGTALASDEQNVVESFDTVDNWLVTDADKISLNTDAEYVKEGTGSLCLRYPVAKRGNDLYISHAEWNNGGLRLTTSNDGLVVKKIGMWVYGCGDDNIQMQISTKSAGESSNIISEPCLLDFEGWKYISFGVSDKTEALFYINVRRVDRNIENPEDKYIYIDELGVEYGYDMSQKNELDSVSNIADGALRVPLDAAPEYTFSNIIDEENMVDVQVSPQIDFSLEKISSKQYCIRFDKPLEIATQYKINFSNVTDIFGQEMNKNFSFTTFDFDLEVQKISNNGTEIERITEAEAGELSLELSLQSYAEVNPNNESLVICSVFDENGYMTGFACQRARLSRQQQTVAINLETSEKPVRGEVFILDSVNNRKIVEHVSLRGE